MDASRRFKATLKGPGPTPQFDFHFDSANALRGRIAVLIGPNGCGKTTSLARLARSLVDLKGTRTKIEPRPEVNQVLAFAHTASLPLFVPRMRTIGSARVRAFALDPLASRRPGREASNTRLLVDVARAHDENGTPTLDYLRSLLLEEFSPLRLYVPVKDPAPSDFQNESGRYCHLANWMVGGGEQRQLEAAGQIDHKRDLLLIDSRSTRRAASLGQLTFLRFALNVLANAGPASALLIDEPENFLHPNLVSRFMRLLNRVLVATKSIAIVATHSPFVVREAQRLQVHVLRLLEDGKVLVTRPLLQTLGANVSLISTEVFGDDTQEHLYQELLSGAMVAGMSLTEVLDRYSQELSTEALMQLRSRIERQ